MQNYLDGLNEAQRDAVLCAKGPLLIVAGAGAGKTKTITHRIAHLIDSGVYPSEILAVTFTNKAAAEMRERVLRLLPSGIQGTPFVSTFHSLGVRLLREFHQEAGLPRSFTIWDRDDSTRSIKRALERLDVSQWTPKSVLGTISHHKGNGASLGEFQGSIKSARDASISQAWAIYEENLREEGALDFDDLLLRALRLLRDDARVRQILQERWTYITIDEYQDTNRAQYEIARLLSGERKNLCVVGDIDQNIYSWRGADIEHLLGFEKAFPGAKVVTLEENYRSTQSILSAANAVIEKNVRRKEKRLFTHNPAGESIVAYAGRNEIDEAWFVAQSAGELIKNGMPADGIAVLYRENFQSRGLEEALLAYGVPYRVLGTRFFERKEVKDALSYLRAAMNPKASVDISRIIASPPRGIGKTTLEKMLSGKLDELSGAAKTKVSNFRALLEDMRASIETLSASEATKACIEKSGLQAAMQEDDEEGPERLENLRELVNLAARYDAQGAPEGIELLLEEAALQSDQDELSKQVPALSLMTVHASKGLEFEAVFVTGLEQGLFPSLREGENIPRDPEEERRLFYVAVTRAKKRLYLLHARERMKYGTREYAIPSEFLEDVAGGDVVFKSRDAYVPREDLID